MTAEGNPVLPQLKPGAAVVVLRLRSMGDTVLTTPALALLRQARPDLETYVVVERPWEQLLASNPDIAGVIAVDRGYTWKALHAVRARRPQLCLNLHGGPTSALLAVLSGAPWRAGFGHFKFQAVYNVRIPRAQAILGRATQAPVHTAEHLASAMFYLGVEPREIPAARLFATAAPCRTPYAVLHVGAAHPAKQWPAERFVELARWLRQSQDLEPLLVAGPGQRSLLAGVKEFETFDDLSLREMMALLKGAELFVGNDSGPAHAAAAFAVPCVVIFGSSDSQVWRPWRTRHEVVESAGHIRSLDLPAVQRAAAGLLTARPALQHE